MKAWTMALAGLVFTICSSSQDATPIRRKQFDKNQMVLLWILRIVASVIMFQAVFLKFFGHPQSIHLSANPGIETWGRIEIGALDSIAVVLVLFPRTTIYGVLLGLGLMTFAMFFHKVQPGILFGGDTALFTYVVTPFAACGLLTFFYRKALIKLAIH